MTAPETAPDYPAAAHLDTADDFHGTRVADPYRWLEDREDPRTIEWLALTVLAHPVKSRYSRWSSLSM